MLLVLPGLRQHAVVVGYLVMIVSELAFLDVLLDGVVVLALHLHVVL